MKAIVCEMCGSNELIKQDGMYVCQLCGTKYSVEEAKKLMVEGTVKIDNSEKLKNYYTLARQARESNDAENAVKYYDLIKQEDPNSWEASFYNVYFRASQTRIMYIQSAANSITNCLGTVFRLIKSGSDGDEEKKKHALEVALRVSYICVLLDNSARSTFVDAYNRAFKNLSTDSCVKYITEYAGRALATADAMFTCGNLIEQDFNSDNSMMGTACSLWKGGISIWKNVYSVYDNHATRYSQIKSSYVSKIQKYESNYSFVAPQYEGFPAPYIRTVKHNSDSDFGVVTSSTTSSSSTSGGCYVATAVYGAYDCPQVWTLRRYRDYTLAKTWYGRAFIHTYYAISPILVKWFGHTEWFKKIWKGKLDRMVEDLQKRGYESTPYQDKEW